MPRKELLQNSITFASNRIGNWAMPKKRVVEGVRREENEFEA